MVARPSRSTMLVHGALFLAQVVWSFNQVASKYALKAQIHPTFYIAFRGFAVPLVFLVAWFSDKTNFVPQTRRERLLVFFMGICNFVTFQSFAFGISITDVTTATILQSTAPLFTFVIAVFLRMEGPSVMKVAGVVCAIIGAIIVMVGPHIYRELAGVEVDTSNKSAFPGGLLLVLNAVAYACYLNAQKKVIPTVPAFTALAWSLLVNGVLSLIVALIFRDRNNISTMTTLAWLSMVYNVLFSMFLGYMLISWAARHTTSTILSVYGTLMPVLAAIFSMIFLHTTIELEQVFGMLFTLMGVGLVIRGRYMEQKATSYAELDEEKQSGSEKEGDVMMKEKSINERESGSENGGEDGKENTSQNESGDRTDNESLHKNISVKMDGELADELEDESRD